MPLADAVAHYRRRFHTPRTRLHRAGELRVACKPLITQVLAIRLYSGPAYQPMNEFLRQIGSLSGIYRSTVAQHVQVTFAATVAQLSSAIRKLAAISSPEEACKPLWRGVRGELSRGFWVPVSPPSSSAL